MTGEAAATGARSSVHAVGRVGQVPPLPRSALQAYGATRPLPERVEALPDWSYEPLHSADTIAREIERHWLSRKDVQP